MSHEGIRIVSEEQARREMRWRGRLPHDAVTPPKVRVMKTEGTGVAIDWKDGHRSRGTSPGCAGPAPARRAMKSVSRRGVPSACPSRSLAGRW